MRESRSSGSVEGVVGNHDPYSDSRAALGSSRSGAFMTPDQPAVSIPPASLVPAPVRPEPPGGAARSRVQALRYVLYELEWHSVSDLSIDFLNRGQIEYRYAQQNRLGALCNYCGWAVSIWFCSRLRLL